MKTCIVLLSGGMDSCVTLAMAIQDKWSPLILHVNYGQKTQTKELESFHAIGDFYQIPEKHRLVVDISHLVAIGGSSLTDQSIPVSKADLGSKEIPTSYVPFRNANILSIAVSWAEVTHSKAIYIGAVEEDSSGYPDCRVDFFKSFEEMVRFGTKPDTTIAINTPVIRMTKSDIVRKGMELGAPLHLTWSCYQGEQKACGSCDSCGLRLRGFKQAGYEDPIPYLVRPDYS